MPVWSIEYFETSSNRCPVFEFIDSLPTTTKVRIRNVFRLLEEFGPMLGLPHLKLLKGFKPLYEIRVLGESSIRIICIIKNHNFLLLHGFHKKSQKIPKKELKTAWKRYRIVA